MFSDFVCQPFIKFEVFTARSKCSKVNNKGKWSTIQQHRQRLEKKGKKKQKKQTWFIDLKKTKAKQEYYIHCVYSGILMEINYTVNVKEHYLIQGSYVLQQY